MHPKKLSKAEENILFFKQFVRNPKTLGSITPSSQALGHFIAKHLFETPYKEGYIVEVGAGTGGLTRALLDSGVDKEKFFVIELDPSMATFLKNSLPTGISIVCGNAENLEMLLPEHVVGNVTAVVSGIPMMNLSLFQQSRLISSWKKVLSPKGSIIQFTYGPLSSLPADRLGLVKKRLGHVLRNFPPATVWKYYVNEKRRYKKASLRTRFKLFVNEELKKVSRNR